MCMNAVGVVHRAGWRAQRFALCLRALVPEDVSIASTVVALSSLIVLECPLRTLWPSFLPRAHASRRQRCLEPWREGLGSGLRVLQILSRIDGKGLGVGNETGSETTGGGRKGSWGDWAWSSLVGTGENASSADWSKASEIEAWAGPLVEGYLTQGHVGNEEKPTGSCVVGQHEPCTDDW